MNRWFLILLLLAPLVLAVNNDTNHVLIQGTVYDFGLNQVSNAIVEINSTPAQKIVAKNGMYAFKVPVGVYSIKASTNGISMIEQVNALAEGEYVLDLILLESLEEEEQLLQQEIETPEVEGLFESKPTMQWALWVIAFLILAAFLIWYSRKKPTTMPDDLHNVLNYINSQGGRVNQKDIVKNLQYSEAKISLMIDELEAQELVKRIKKGRGNIIIKQ